MTIQDIIQRKNALNVSGILKEAFQDRTDFNRVQTKIQRGKPELTSKESESIQKALDQLKIKFT